MELYLMRHGIAYERHEWDGGEVSRPLTDEGVARTRAVAKALKKDRKVEVDAVWSSPLVRARQTAELIAEAMGVKLTESEALAPGTNFKILGKAFSKLDLPDRLMLVGHEPDFGILLGDLIGDEDVHPFKKAGVAFLAGAFKAGGMKLKWQAAPKDLLED